MESPYRPTTGDIVRMRPGGPNWYGKPSSDLAMEVVCTWGWTQQARCVVLGEKPTLSDRINVWDLSFEEIEPDVFMTEVRKCRP